MMDHIIDWLLELGIQIDAAGTMAGTVTGQWIKCALGLILIWPLAMIFAGALLQPSAIHVAVPLITLLPLVGFVGTIFLARSLYVTVGAITGITLASTIPGKNLLKKLGTIFSFELGMGIYFSLVPISNKLEYVPLLILVFVCILFFRGRARGVAIALFVILTIGFFSIDGLTKSLTMGSQSAPFPGYVKAFCPARTLFDYRNENPQSITITLQEGCYHGEYILPLAWDRYSVQKSTTSGDYATVWCNGSDQPGEIRGNYEDMGKTMDPCRDRDEVVPHFSIEGKGTMTLTRTKEHKIWTPFGIASR